ncbi:MAG: hypothetical protein PHF37_01590 [Phycisphaerae bacterium]|nr:hypothetical protein [Phycisphaerae bacterium]
MKDDLKKSLDRAIKLTEECDVYDNYISVKIIPIPNKCCCFHCWPHTWNFINQKIHPFGPLKDEGDVVIEKNNEIFVLQCHESGPEIISLITASVDLITGIIDLITALLKTVPQEHNPPSQLKIIKRKFIRGKMNEENIIEVNISVLKEKDLERVSKVMKKALIEK